MTIDKYENTRAARTQASNPEPRWSPRELTREEKDRRNRQAAHRRALKKARHHSQKQSEANAAVEPVTPDEQEVEVVVAAEPAVQTDVQQTDAAAEPATFPPIPNGVREDFWQSAEKVRRTRDLSQLAHAIEEGWSAVDDVELAKAAVALVRHLRAERVTNWSWPPCPTVDELAAQDDWLAQRLSAAQAEQQAGQKERQARNRLRQAGLSSQPAGGPGVPVRLQRLKITLDEARERLAHVVKTHEERTGGQFKREWLDHRYPHFITNADGGLSNKQIVLMANEIAGNNDERSFDESWAIVTEDMRANGFGGEAFA
jgi:hypothetical protein